MRENTSSWSSRPHLHISLCPSASGTWSLVETRRQVQAAGPSSLSPPSGTGRGQVPSIQFLLPSPHIIGTDVEVFPDKHGTPQQTARPITLPLALLRSAHLSKRSNSLSVCSNGPIEVRLPSPSLIKTNGVTANIFNSKIQITSKFSWSWSNGIN